MKLATMYASSMRPRGTMATSKARRCVEVSRGRKTCSRSKRATKAMVPLPVTMIEALGGKELMSPP